MNAKSEKPDSREQRIIAAICQHLDVDWTTLQSRVRTRELSEGRQLLCFVLLQAGYSPAHIARTLQRNHSTVVHAIGRVQQRPALESDGRWLAEQVLPMVGEGEERHLNGLPIEAISHALLRALVGRVLLADARAVRAYVCSTLLAREHAPGAQAVWGLWLVTNRRAVRRVVHEVLTNFGLGVYQGLIDLQWKHVRE